MIGNELFPGPGELRELFRLKYGSPDSTGWSPRRRLPRGYCLPAEVYGALVAKAVRPGISWIDVGAGSLPFPTNPAFARTLADRAGLFFGVDPSENIAENPFVHRYMRAALQDRSCGLRHEHENPTPTLAYSGCTRSAE